MIMMKENHDNMIKKSKEYNKMKKVSTLREPYNMAKLSQKKKFIRMLEICYATHLRTTY